MASHTIAVSGRLRVAFSHFICSMVSIGVPGTSGTYCLNVLALNSDNKVPCIYKLNVDGIADSG